MWEMVKKVKWVEGLTTRRWQSVIERGLPVYFILGSVPKGVELDDL